MASFELPDVVGIIDMDGFTIRKMFHCKELGIIRMGEAVAKSLFFDIGMIYQKGDKGGIANAKMCTFFEQNICVFLCLHKLTYKLMFGIIYFCKYYRQ